MQSTVRAANPNNSVVVPMSALDQSGVSATDASVRFEARFRTSTKTIYLRRASAPRQV